MWLAFMFPGQGSQAVGMGKALAEAFPAARAVFDEVDAALGEKLAIIWEGPAETLTLTENAQPALMAVSLAAMRVLEAEAGFSMGRAMRLRRRPFARRIFGAGCRRQRSRSAIPRACCASAAVPCRRRCRSAPARWRRCFGLDFEAAAAVAARSRAGQVCQAANDNGGGQVVVSGDKAAVERAVEIAKAKGAKRAMLLPVSAPFHCALMQPAADVMAEALAKVTIKRAGGAAGRQRAGAPISDPDEIVRRLVEQVTGTVRWRESVAYMAARASRVLRDRRRQGAERSGQAHRRRRKSDVPSARRTILRPSRPRMAASSKLREGEH